MEGQYLHIAVAGTQQTGLPAFASAEVQAAHADIAAEGAELRPVPDPPLVLYCIQANVLQAEKLRPMFSTPDVRPPLPSPPLPSPPLPQPPAQAHTTAPILAPAGGMLELRDIVLHHSI